MRPGTLALALAVQAIVVVGAVTLLLLVFFDQTATEVDREAERIEREIDRDVRELRRDVLRELRRELDRRLPAAPGAP